MEEHVLGDHLLGSHVCDTHEGQHFVGLAGGQGGVHVHFALHIAEDDYAAAVERLREQGYEPHEEDFEENGRAAYVTDPDGNVVELWTWDVAGHLA